jgi:hypothetical protein
VVVPVDLVLIVEGFHVPVISLFDSVSNEGAFAPAQSVGILINVGITEALTVTFSVPDDALQPLLLLTVTDIVSEVPDDGAVYLMLFVPLPDVIVEPELSAHTYVPPLTTGTEAVLPVEPAHTELVVVMVALGSATIGITLLADVLLQPLLLVLTLSVTDPDLVAV